MTNGSTTTVAAETIPLYAAFPARRILFEDESVVVVDKPFGLATHAPDESRHDDVISWLGQHYRARGVSPYVGVHQRLDRETSGVLLFARHKDDNKKLAEQFERRLVKKVYVAVVEGRIPDETSLHHYIGETADGQRTARAFDRRPRRGEQEAITEMKVLERRGKRSLVELSPKTGRTHQLRVQMAAIRAPIVGDAAYGGAPDTRLMLHARQIGLSHPRTGKPLSIQAPIPADLARALRGEASTRPTSRDEIALRIEEAAERRYGVVALGDTNAFRIVHGAGDGLPGITIDLYGRHAVLSFYEEIERREADALANAIVDCGIAGVYAKFRPKHASRIVDSRREDIAPATPIAGAEAPASFEISEHGTPYEVHLADGLSTGIFLDQRENRKRIAALSEDKTLLNLFAYTGAFSVVAAAAGAKGTTTVDTSRIVLDWAERNLRRVGADPARHESVESDVFAFLARAKATRRTWDIAVLDPPSFSTTKKSTFSAESDYEKLAAATLEIIAPGGRLLACTNHRGISMAQFRKRLHGAARLAKREVRQMKNFPPPTDYPPPPGEEPHLKSVLLTLA
ncbi:MAG: hypothetical protein HOW73_35435 [Polyangiaceae bacterium]|nr:hypothetical protein [Polyangiaceae bacterium]